MNSWKKFEQRDERNVNMRAVEWNTSLLSKLVYGPSISITPITKHTKPKNKHKLTKKKSTKNDGMIVQMLDSAQDDLSPKEADPLEIKPSSTQAVHCETCDEIYENNVAFALHSIAHNSDNKYSCHLCDYRNIFKYNIEMHIKAHEGTTKYKCEICQKAFTTSTHAIEHKYFHTGEKPFQCEICGKHFMFSWFLTSHRRMQHWEIITGTPLVKYDCTVCNKHYTSATGLRRHNMSKHNVAGVESSLLCDICGKCLSSKEKLKFHRRIHTGYKPFACEICTKSFSRKELLKEHERVHTGEKPYICDFCGKGFSQRSPLRIHKRTHTGERPYICRICGKGFISKGVMDTHMKSTHHSLHYNHPTLVINAQKFSKTRRNTGNMSGSTKKEHFTIFKDLSYFKKHVKKHQRITKTFDCPECSRTFDYKSRLNAHIKKVHTNPENNKMLICDECGKCISAPNGMVKHKRIHTGEKTHVCEHCGKGFAGKNTLIAHLRVHTKERPFKCSYCEKSFTQKGSLNIHCRIHTGVKPYKCGAGDFVRFLTHRVELLDQFQRNKGNRMIVSLSKYWHHHRLLVAVTRHILALVFLQAYLKAEVHSNKRAQIPVFETIFSAHEHYFHSIRGVENELPLLFGPVLYVLILT
ncbi:zinc finger protein ZFP2-like [Zophobas morio]|uniref:zinc finger protein ZFP2-like n=1 Tax=Zophobas morio TaxID=2755281 RepID=UPI003083E61B